MFDCNNDEDERNCTSKATSAVTPKPHGASRDEIYVSDGAIWTLVVSITIVFILVALIMWIKFRSDRNIPKSRFAFSDCDTDRTGSLAASDRVASIDRMRRQRNLNFERPQSYHYSSRPNSMIYIGSQDNVRSISSQLSWYSQQLISAPRTPNSSLSIVDIPVVCPHTSIEHFNEEGIQSDSNSRNEIHGTQDNDSSHGDILIHDEEQEPLQGQEIQVTPPPDYSECNDTINEIPPTAITVTATTAAVSETQATPPPTYSDSLLYNFITYV